MIYGNWVAIHKGLSRYFPIDRPYTELEAMVSVTIDIDGGKSGSIAGYAALWTWSRNKVRKFFQDVGIEIIYPESLEKKQNQKGQIKGQIRDRSGTDQGQIRIIIDKALYNQKDRSGTDQGQIRDRSKDTTIDPIDPDPNPDKKRTVKKAVQKPENVTDQTWNDFLIVRNKKRAPLTETALNGILKQAEKAGYTLEQALKECSERGWAGFKAEWVKSKQNGSSKYEALN